MFAQCVQRVLLSDHMVQPTYPRLHDIGHQRTNTNDPMRKKKKKSADNRPMNRSLKGLPVRMDVGSKQRHTWVDMWSRVLYKELMDGPLKRTLT